MRPPKTHQAPGVIVKRGTSAKHCEGFALSAFAEDLALIVSGTDCGFINPDGTPYDPPYLRGEEDDIWVHLTRHVEQHEYLRGGEPTTIFRAQFWRKHEAPDDPPDGRAD